MTNKTALVLKLVSLILVFLLVALFALRVVTRGLYESFSFNLGERLVMSESFKNVQNIEVDSISYSVTVAESDGEQTVVEFYSGLFGTAPEPEAALSGDTLAVKQRQGVSGTVFGSGRIVISVPARSNYDYRIESASGSIRLAAGSQSAELASVSGSVRVSASGGSLAASSASGSIKVSEPFKSIVANSVSGSVRVAADGASEKLTLASTSGSIKIMLGANDPYTMDFTTTTGSVKDEYRGVSYGKSGRAEWGSDGVKISAQTVSGSIKLCDWND